MVRRPELSVGLNTFLAGVPSGWRTLLDHAQIADAASVDRLNVPYQVVFGDYLTD